MAAQKRVHRGSIARLRGGHELAVVGDGRDGRTVVRSVAASDDRRRCEGCRGRVLRRLSRRSPRTWWIHQPARNSPPRPRAQPDSGDRGRAHGEAFGGDRERAIGRCHLHVERERPGCAGLHLERHRRVHVSRVTTCAAHRGSRASGSSRGRALASGVGEVLRIVSGTAHLATSASPTAALAREERCCWLISASTALR